MNESSTGELDSDTSFAGSHLGRLWTPWRREYVTGAATGGCFLCALVAASPVDDESNLVLRRDAGVLLLLNRFPYSPGHCLVAPSIHQGDFTRLEPDLRDRLFALAQRATGALTSVYQPAGLNLGMNLGRVAGAGVPDHLHLHLVPRWAGDTNFMSVTAETRVLPETLGESYARLRPLFA